MKKRHLTGIWFVSAFLVLTSLGASAAPSQWQIVPDESQLMFTATQNGAPVSGQFKTFTADLLVDPTDFKSSKIDVVVDINSLTASFADLKATLMTPDWFNTAVFPKAEFKATQFDKIGSNAYQAHGTLTIRNQSAPVTVTFTTESSPGKGIVVGKTTIKRSTFGVGQGEWAGTDEIKDEVMVSFKLVVIKK